MRQAIVTKYLGPTNTRGSRVKATAAAHGALADLARAAEEPPEAP